MSKNSNRDRDDRENGVNQNTNSELEALKAKIATLEQENKTLAKENEKLSREEKKFASEAQKKTKKARTNWAIAIALVAALLVGLAIPAVWLKTTVMSTDRWVATVAPLSRNADIQKAVTDEVAAYISEEIDAQALAEEYLPEEALPLAPAIANAVDSFITEQTGAFIASDAFSSVWEEVNRVGHDVVIEVVTEGSTGPIDSKDGTVSLNISTLIDEVKTYLVENGFEIAQEISSEDFKGESIELFSSPVLGEVQSTLNLLQQVAIILPLVALILSAGAIALATDRRKVTMWLAGGIAIATLIPWLALVLAQNPIINSVAQLGASGNAALAAIYSIVLHPLWVAQAWVFALSLIAWFVALCMGTSKFALWVQEVVKNIARFVTEKIDAAKS